jgi:hypothetical protein
MFAINAGPSGWHAASSYKHHPPEYPTVRYSVSTMHIRRATVADAQTITQQRVRMFADAQIADEQVTAPMVGAFRPWLEARSTGVKVITFAASKYGRPLFESYGFTATNEMILRV